MIHSFYKYQIIVNCLKGYFCCAALLQNIHHGILHHFIMRNQLSPTAISIITIIDLCINISSLLFAPFLVSRSKPPTLRPDKICMQAHSTFQGGLLRYHMRVMNQLMINYSSSYGMLLISMSYTQRISWSHLFYICYISAMGFSIILK